MTIALDTHRKDLRNWLVSSVEALALTFNGDTVRVFNNWVGDIDQKLYPVINITVRGEDPEEWTTSPVSYKASPNVQFDFYVDKPGGDTGALADDLDDLIEEVYRHLAQNPKANGTMDKGRYARLDQGFSPDGKRLASDATLMWAYQYNKVSVEIDEDDPAQQAPLTDVRVDIETTEQPAPDPNTPEMQDEFDPSNP